MLEKPVSSFFARNSKSFVKSLFISGNKEAYEVNLSSTSNSGRFSITSLSSRLMFVFLCLPSAALTDSLSQSADTRYSETFWSVVVPTAYL